MANYPSTQNTDDNLYVGVNNLSTVLTDNPLTAGATTVNVSDTTGFPTVGILTIDLEAIHYTGTTATSFTGCTRGFDGTTGASHPQNTTVFHDIPAAHHNVLKDEIKALSDDLRDAFTGDLDDSATVAATAADLKERLDQIVTQVKDIISGSDWKDSPATTINAIDTLLDSTAASLDDDDTPADTASDLKDRLDQIVSLLKDITGETNWYDTPASTISSLESGTVKTTGAQNVGGVKTFTDNPIVSKTSEPTLDVQETTNTVNLRIRAESSSAFVGTDSNHDFEIKANNTTGVTLDASDGSSVGLKGTVAGGNATAGNVGEYMESKSSTPANFPTSGNYGDAGSLALSAGDWDLSYQVIGIINGSTWERIDAGIGTASGTSSTGIVNGENTMQSLFASSSSTPVRVPLTVATYRVSISSSTTYYAKILATYSAGTPQYIFRFSARRVR